MAKPIKHEVAEFLASPVNAPHSLFRRVRQVLGTPRRLAIRPNRLASIAKTWPSTPEELERVLDFYPEEWQLVRVEVRRDTGKFVRSTWRRQIGRKWYSVTIGYGDSVEELWWQHDSHETPDISELLGADNGERELVETVERVNAGLLERNAPFSPAVHPLPPRQPAGGRMVGKAENGDGGET